MVHGSWCSRGMKFPPSRAERALTLLRSGYQSAGDDVNSDKQDGACKSVKVGSAPNLLGICSSTVAGKKI